MINPRIPLISLTIAAALALSGMAAAGDDGKSATTSGRMLEDMAMDSPDKLLGKRIQRSDGQTLGEIDKVVRRKADDKIYLVLDSEGYLQPVIPESALALEDLDMQGDDIVLMSQDAETHLSRETYSEEEFEEVAD